MMNNGGLEMKKQFVAMGLCLIFGSVWFSNSYAEELNTSNAYDFVEYMM